MFEVSASSSTRLLANRTPVEKNGQCLNATFPSQFENKSCPAFFKICTNNNSSSPTISFHREHLCDVHDHGHLVEDPSGPYNDRAAATLLSDGPFIKESLLPDAPEGHVPHVGNGMHNATTGTFVQADNRSPVHIFCESPEVPWIQPQDIIQLKLLFETYDKKIFGLLVGGSARGQIVHQYTPELTKFPEMFNLVKKCIAPYLDFVQTKYPSLQHFKLAALKTEPNAECQYERCNWRLHWDYDDRVNLRPPHDRPVSLMVAIDPFEFIYLKNRNDRRMLQLASTRFHCHVLGMVFQRLEAESSKRSVFTFAGTFNVGRHTCSDHIHGAGGGSIRLDILG